MKLLAAAAFAALLIVPLAGEAFAAPQSGPLSRGGGGAISGPGGTGGFSRGGGGGGAMMGGGGGGFRNGGGGAMRNGGGGGFRGRGNGGYRGGYGGGYRGGYRGRNSIVIAPGYYPGFYDPFYPYGYGYGFGFGYNSYYPYDYADYAYVPPPGRDGPYEDDYLPPQQEYGPAPEQVWYYCSSPQGYYPYVRECSTDWQSVPANPPGTGQQGSNAPAELSGPPNDRASLERN